MGFNSAFKGLIKCVKTSDSQAFDFVTIAPVILHRVLTKLDWFWSHRQTLK